MQQQIDDHRAVINDSVTVSVLAKLILWSIFKVDVKLS